MSQKMTLPSRYATSKKTHARAATIVDTYRSIFGRQQMPIDKQYWSMCAACVDDDGQPLLNSELHQAVESRLIQPHQFHGVDRDEEVYAVNCRYTKAHWYCDDFYFALSRAVDQPNFDPGIINVDTLSEPRRGVDLFCRILERLRDYTDILFVGNFILKNRGRQYTVEDVVRQINKNARFRVVAHTLQWDVDRTFYSYRGATTSDRTIMCTVLLWRRTDNGEQKDQPRAAS